MLGCHACSTMPARSSSTAADSLPPRNPPIAVVAASRRRKPCVLMSLRVMPVIMYYEDSFTEPEFKLEFIVGIDEVIDIKLQIARLNASQVYEWLPYTNGETVPTDEKARFEWLKGMNTDSTHTDREIMSLPRGYAVRFAKPAAKFRDKLIEKYGKEKGARIRYAEAFGLCPYGGALNEEVKGLFGKL